MTLQMFELVKEDKKYFWKDTFTEFLQKSIKFLPKRFNEGTRIEWYMPPDETTQMLKGHYTLEVDPGSKEKYWVDEDGMSADLNEAIAFNASITEWSLGTTIKLTDGVVAFGARK